MDQRRQFRRQNVGYHLKCPLLRQRTQVQGMYAHAFRRRLLAPACQQDQQRTVRQLFHQRQGQRQRLDIQPVGIFKKQHTRSAGQLPIQQGDHRTGQHLAFAQCELGGWFEPHLTVFPGLMIFKLFKQIKAATPFLCGDV